MGPTQENNSDQRESDFGAMAAVAGEFVPSIGSGEQFGG